MASLDMAILYPGHTYRVCLAQLVDRAPAGREEYGTNNDYILSDYTAHPIQVCFLQVQSTHTAQ
jgi:hypothetical protein